MHNSLQELTVMVPMHLSHLCVVQSCTKTLGAAT
jgi:hypothetical protein